MEQWRGLHTISTSVLATLHPSHRCRGRCSQVCSTLQHQQDNSHRRFSFDASLSSAVHQVSLLLRCWGGIQLLLTAFFSLYILISLYSLALRRCTEGVIVPNSFPSQLFLFLLCFYFFLHILCLSMSMVTRYLFVYIYWSLDSPFFFLYRQMNLLFAEVVDRCEGTLLCRGGEWPGGVSGRFAFVLGFLASTSHLCSVASRGMCFGYYFLRLHCKQFGVVRFSNGVRRMMLKDL